MRTCEYLLVDNKECGAKAVWRVNSAKRRLCFCDRCADIVRENYRRRGKQIDLVRLEDSPA